MTSIPYRQQNPYKGTSLRCWIRLRFAAADGSLHERELVADTGSPCAVILGQNDLALLLRSTAAGMNSNFGQLTGAWLELNMPELGLNTQIIGYGSDRVLQTVGRDRVDFVGVVGLPLLRMMEYGGDATSFWVQKPPHVILGTKASSGSVIWRRGITSTEQPFCPSCDRQKARNNESRPLSDP